LAQVLESSVAMACRVLALAVLQGVLGDAHGTCRQYTVDFIFNKGVTLDKDIEDDIRADLAKVGITVNARPLEKDDFNTAMTDGDFHLAFSESQGPPYDPQAYATSWAVPDEAYYAALKGLPAPNTKDVLIQKIKDVQKQVAEADREAGWAEILKILHDQATELPLLGKRIPSVINTRLSGYRDGLQQYDYPLHTLKVASGSRTVALTAGSATGTFQTVGNLNPHTYRPNEFWVNNLVYDGLVEYGPGGVILPALATSWTLEEVGAGMKATFTLRTGVKFHDGADWNCAVAKLNFDHFLGKDMMLAKQWHNWYGLMAVINGVSCDGESLVLTTSEKYYPLLQELSFIRPTRMLSPNKFSNGLASDVLTENSCPKTLDADGNPTPNTWLDTMTCTGPNAPADAIGTGRWKYHSTVYEADGTTEKEVHFQANPDHWDFPAGADTVEVLKVVVLADEAAVKVALDAGTIDAVIGAGIFGKTNIEAYEANSNFKVSFTEPIQNRIVIFNTAKAPTDSLELRKVIIHAVDKAALVKKEMGDLAQPVDSLFPKHAPYCNVELTPKWDYDIEKAQLLNCIVPGKDSEISTLQASLEAKSALIDSAAWAGAALLVLAGALA